MTMLPQPASELPPPPAQLLPPPDPDPQTRRYLFWSGWMILGLAVLNLILFRQWGCDVYLVIILAGAIPCFFYQFFSRTMRILKWFWVALTLPYWAVFLYVIVQMGAALYLQATVPLLPASALAIPEFTPEQKRNLDLLHTKFADPKTMDPAVEQLYQAWQGSMSRKRPISTFFAEPTAPDIIAKAGVVLDEYMAIAIAAPPSAYVRSVDAALESARHKYVQAQLVRRAWLFQQGRIPESQQLYLRQLEANLNELTYPQHAGKTGAAISNAKRIVLYQWEKYPRLSEGAEREILALIRQIQARLRPAAADAYGPMAHRDLRQDLDDLREEGALDRNYRAGIYNRLARWPFLVTNATLVDYARDQEKLRAMLSFDAVEARSVRTGAGHSDWSCLRSPNPGGIWVRQIFGNDHSLTLQMLYVESTLKAYELALSWQVREVPIDFAAQVDPATTKGYIVSESSTGGVETLVIAGGGTPTISHSKKSSPSPMEKRLMELHMTNATYLFEVSRPASPAP